MFFSECAIGGAGGAVATGEGDMEVGVLVNFLPYIKCVRLFTGLINPLLSTHYAENVVRG